MSIVVSEVNKHKDASKPEWRVVTLVNDADGTKRFKDFIVFKAELAEKLEIGKPLPDGTEEEPPKFDGALPSLKLPWKKDGGGRPQAAWRNTKEGFLAEQQMWREKHEREDVSFRAKEYREEERKDRRTALMTVAEAMNSGMAVTDFLETAGTFYDWLRETAPADGNSYGEGEAVAEESGGGGTDLTRASSGPAPSPRGSQ